ncbi:hypothetical protein LLH23_16300 [bacterium]|nr:hypothetical protein [bacterium]
MRHLVLLAALVSSIALAQPEGAWLNVLDCGASGSKFQTKATLTAGSKDISVADPGDFKVGQGVMVSRADIKISHGTLWGPRAKYAASKALADTVQVRGYDGSLGSWTVYILDIDGANPATFRWSDDLTRTWKQSKVPITHDWQPLNGGTEVKFGELDWDSGYAVTFSARDQLLTVIEKIEGKTVTLRDAPTRGADDAVVRHNDTEALQAAIDRGLKEKRNVFFPAGWYMLARPLVVQNAEGIVLQGLNGVDSVLDISEGEGACFNLKDGKEVTIRNFRMLGNTGFDARDQAGSLRLMGALAVWGFYLKPSHGMTVSNTERVLLENCHASKMSGECFYSGGRSRTWNQPEPKQYTKEITYLRCSVTDSGRNAFNNNDMAENTSVLYCRVVDVGGCTWEGASRFVRFIGNYVRNAGTVAMGNIRSRDERYEQLGSGQHIIADNVFEGNICYGGAAIRAAAGASQVVIRNNLFINFGSSGVDISGVNSNRDLTAGIATVSDNIFDMTDVTGQSKARTSVLVSGSHVTVSNNQFYVRGAMDPAVTAIDLREPAVNLSVHDNLIRNCGKGLSVGLGSGRITEVVSPTSFVVAGTIPLERRQSHRYRGWGVSFIRGGNRIGRGTIKEFDPETCQFILDKPFDLKVGDSVEVFPTAGANWSLTANTITSCVQPVTLDGYGSLTSRFADNLISRGETPAKEAVAVRGAFDLTGNHFSGFTDEGSAALSLYPDRFGKPLPLQVRDNIFETCGNPVAESVKGLWDACRAEGNVFQNCTAKPVQKALPPQTVTAVLRKVEAPAAPILKAPKLAKAIKLDGDVSEWPWADKTRVATLQQDAMGAPISGPKGAIMAARDAQFLYVAVCVNTLPNYKLTLSGAPYSGDGMEIAYQSGDPQVSSPILVQWGGADGARSLVAVGGADAAQSAALDKLTQYAAKQGKDQWTAEWRLPLSVLGPKFAQVKRLRFNLGLRHHNADLWIAWVGTGAEIFRVDRAGVVELW